MGRSGGCAYTFCAHTSGEFGSGTGRGLLLRSKTSLEASSSWVFVATSFGAIDGAVFVTACFWPDIVSSEIDCMAVGAIGELLRGRLYAKASACGKRERGSAESGFGIFNDQVNVPMGMSVALADESVLL